MQDTHTDAYANYNVALKSWSMFIGGFKIIKLVVGDGVL